MMSNKRGTLKLLPIWCAVSAVFIIAGIILLALLGFNYASEVVKSKTVEIEFGVATQIDEGGEKALKDACDSAFEKAGVSYKDYRIDKQVDSSSFSESIPQKLIYTFAENADLTKAVAEVNAACASFFEKDDDFTVTTHTYEVQQNIQFESQWRGALAIGVTAIVALIYVGIRFGVGSALTGLTMCANDCLLTMSLLAIARIPVYFYAPLVYIAIAALVSVIAWMLQCMKMKENFKSPEYSSLTAEEAVEKSRKTSMIGTIVLIAGLAIAVIAAGAMATAGSRLFFLPALLPVALPLYSSLLLGPALHVHVKAAFDKWKAKRNSNKNKKKTVKTAETEFGK